MLPSIILIELPKLLPISILLCLQHSIYSGVPEKKLLPKKILLLSEHLIDSFSLTSKFSHILISESPSADMLEPEGILQFLPMYNFPPYFVK